LVTLAALFPCYVDVDCVPRNIYFWDWMQFSRSPPENSGFCHSSVFFGEEPLSLVHMFSQYLYQEKNLLI